MKFGGTSVQDTAHIKRAADKVAAEVQRGNEVAVVVSAMSGETNKLIALCKEISPNPNPQEIDAVVASGEQVTAGLLALALQERDIDARSWLGWQAGVKTSESHSKARIEDIDAAPMRERLSLKQVAVLAGFQGVTKNGRITTLGRGGSDTTAVALAAALHADRCDIYTDVDGIYTTDPRIVPGAQKIAKISYEEMLELASLGAKVLQVRSVEMGYKHNMALQVLSSFNDAIGSDFPGTQVVREDDIMEQQLVTGIAHTEDEAKVTLFNVPDIPGVAAKVFGPIAAANINVDMIVQNVSGDGNATDMTFTVPESELARAVDVLKQEDDLKDADIRTEKDVAKVSVVGIGMRSHAGVAQQMFKALADKDINIKAIATSEIKISVLIARDSSEPAVRALHDAYGLHKQ